MYTIGYDSFGLPAEQYAVQTGQHPRMTTEDEHREHAAVSCPGWVCGTTPDRTFSTTDPDVREWTQWIFLQIFDSWYDPEAPRRRVRGAARPIAEWEKLRSSAVDQ